MASNPDHSDPDRFRPHAVRELGAMFDDVSGRYDFLNRVMSLGQDRAWRAAMWRAVPENAHAVLDLCTGSGVSLTGLRRPGRLVIGADVSLRMLEIAAANHGTAGWAPRLVCSDAFVLPLGDRSLDAITIAFGIRNLRPLERALAELARVLRPGGTLVVLEAAAPAPGPFAPFHRFYLRRIVPLAGRLSPDPSAYEYLSRSIFEFGSGPEFESALAAAGFVTTGRRQFMLGATRLWIAERAGQESAATSRGSGTGQDFAAGALGRMQNARAHGANGVNLPRRADRLTGEWRAWTGIQLALSVALTAAFVQALLMLVNSRDDLPLNDWQRNGAWLLVVGGLLVFGLRSVQLVLRFLGARTRP